MAITNGYATLQEFQEWGEIQTVTDHVPDHERAIEAASRWVDQYCERHFWKTAAGTARVMDASSTSELRLGPFNDLAVLGALATDDDGDGVFEATWVAADYQLLPLTPAAAPEPRPYRMVSATGTRWFPRPDCVGRRGLVRVTGEWGWPSVPTAVKQACLIQASRLAKRRISPEGVTGFGSEFGPIRLTARPDPDAVALLAPYRLTAVLVA